MGDYEKENNVADVTENDATSEIISDVNSEPITESTSDTVVEQVIPTTNINTSAKAEPVLDNTPPSSAPLVLGILSFLGILIPLVGYILSVTGIVISVKDKKKPNTKYGNTGLILSIIALVLSFIMHLINIMILSSIVR